MTSYSEHLSFQQSAEPITGPVSKLGGQPHWIDTPSWPISKQLGVPMTFIGQIRIEGPLFGNPEPFRMAYLFITDGGEEHDGTLPTYDPDAGENAIVIQPGTYHGLSQPLHTGPTVKVNTLSYNTVFEPRISTSPIEPVWSIDDAMARAEAYRASYPFVPLDPALGSEFNITTQQVEEYPYTNDICFDSEITDEQADEFERIVQSWSGTKIGGSPSWIQYEQFPFPNWFLLFQALDETLPVDVNFGTGSVYCFVDKELTIGKMLWQC